MLRAHLLAIAGLLAIVSVQSVSASMPGFQSCQSVPIQCATLSGVELDHWLAATSVRLDGAARSIAPEDVDDMLAILDIVGFEPLQLRDWVAQNTGYIPYSGSLRGAQGVLIERRGNSLDRALLLSALVEAAGFDIRLAQGSAIAVAPHSAPRPEADNNALGMEILPLADRPAAEQGLARIAACEAATLVRIGQQTATLLTLFGEQPTTKPAPNSEDAYWWVQVKIAGTWTNLFIDDVSAGLPVAAATYPPDRLPQGLAHSITFRFVAEVWNSKRAVRHTLLEHQARAADLLGKSLWLGQRPEPTSALIEAMAASTDTALINAFDTAPVWTPEVRIGSKAFIDKAISVDGRVAPATPAGLARLGSEAVSGAAALGGTGGGLLSGAFGGGGLRGGRTDTPAPTLLAEWLEIEIIVPGREVRRERRMLFDALAGLRPERGRVAARQVREAGLEGRGLALLTSIEGGMVGFDPSPAYLARETMLAASIALEALAMGQAEPETRFIPDRGIAFLGFARMRMQMGGDGVYAARPNLVLLHSSLRQHADDGLALVRTVDVLDNAVASADTASFAARLRQGVADTVLENRFLGNGGLDATNASNRMAQSDGAWRRIGPDDATALERLDLPRKLASQMAGDLARGYVLITPEPTVGAGSYWRIDPDTGDTLGIGPGGAGMASDYSQLIKEMGTDLRVAVSALGQYQFVVFGCLAAKAAGVLDSNAKALACIATGLTYAWGGHAMLFAGQSRSIYLAGRAAKLGAAGVLGALGVIEYSAQNSFRKWLKGLFQQ